MSDSNEPVFIKYLKWIEESHFLPFTVDDMLRNHNIRDHLLKSGHYARWKLEYYLGQFKSSLIRNTFLRNIFKNQH